MAKFIHCLWCNAEAIVAEGRILTHYADADGKYKCPGSGQLHA